MLGLGRVGHGSALKNLSSLVVEGPVSVQIKQLDCLGFRILKALGLEFRASGMRILSVRFYGSRAVGILADEDTVFPLRMSQRGSA